MTELYVVLGIVAVVALLVWLGFSVSRKRGAAEQRAEQSESVMERVNEAKNARDAVRRDSADARRERLRKWTRE